MTLDQIDWGIWFLRSSLHGKHGSDGRWGGTWAAMREAFEQIALLAFLGHKGFIRLVNGPERNGGMGGMMAGGAFW